MYTYTPHRFEAAAAAAAAATDEAVS